MPFLIEFEGATYNTEELSINESIKIEEDTGLSWRFLSPLQSAKHWKAITTAFLARDKGWDEARAYMEAYCEAQGSLNSAVGTIKPAPDSLPDLFEDGIPKAEDGGQTPGSSGAFSDSDGPQT